jgi:hypothetical protein
LEQVSADWGESYLEMGRARASQFPFESFLINTELEIAWNVAPVRHTCQPRPIERLNIHSSFVIQSFSNHFGHSKAEPDSLAIKTSHFCQPLVPEIVGMLSLWIETFSFATVVNL